MSSKDTYVCSFEVIEPVVAFKEFNKIRQKPGYYWLKILIHNFGAYYNICILLSNLTKPDNYSYDTTEILKT